MDSKTLTLRLQARLEDRAKPERKAWWDAYLKQAIPFRGVSMAETRSALHDWYDEEQIADRLSLELQKSLALGLFEEGHAEDKIAGILFLQEILLPAGALIWQRDLPRFAELFRNGWIYDWNVCDWFCVKVLGPLVQKEGKACARAVSEWRTAENLWQRRSAAVAFVNLAKRGDDNFAGFSDMVLETCAATVKHQERFSQTGTAWVLRELSVAEPERVRRFVEEHVCYFSGEGMRYALGKLSPVVRRRLTELRGRCG